MAILSTKPSLEEDWEDMFPEKLGTNFRTLKLKEEVVHCLLVDFLPVDCLLVRSLLVDCLLVHCLLVHRLLSIIC